MIEELIEYLKKAAVDFYEKHLEDSTISLQYVIAFIRSHLDEE